MVLSDFIGLSREANMIVLYRTIEQLKCYRKPGKILLLSLKDWLFHDFNTQLLSVKLFTFRHLAKLSVAVAFNIPLGKGSIMHDL